MISKISSVMMSAFVIGQVSAWALADQKPQWKGTITKDGDIVVVYNPKNPQYGADAFSLEEDLAIRGQDSAGYVLAEITSISMSADGTIFILDSKERNVKAFSQEGKFLRIIGKAGEGPGEFSMPNYIHCTNRNEVVVVEPRRRLSVFKPNGEHVKDISTGALYLMDACPDSGGNFFGYLIIRDESNPRYELRILDAGLNNLFVLDSSPVPNTARDGFNPVFPILRWSMLSGDKAVCGYAVKYELRIYDAKGRFVRKIEMHPDPISISQKDIEERTAGVPPSFSKKVKFPKYFPYFRYLKADDEDRIFVATFERAQDKKRNWFDIFDSAGRYIVRAVLPGLIPLIRKGHLYAIEETDEGYPVLKRYKMRWKF